MHAFCEVTLGGVYHLSDSANHVTWVQGDCELGLHGHPRQYQNSTQSKRKTGRQANHSVCHKAPAGSYATSFPSRQVYLAQLTVHRRTTRQGAALQL